MVERAPFGIYIVDSQFRIAQMNAGSQTGAFRNVRPVIGRDFAEAMRILWPEPVAAEIIAAFRHTLETGEPYYSPRFINPRHDVEIVEAYEWELHRMTLPDGQYGVICYYFDSTKLREAEEALRESEERLRLLGDNLPDSAVYQYVHETDGSVRFLYFSAGIERLNGVSVERRAARRGHAAPAESAGVYRAAGRGRSPQQRELSDFDMELPMRRPDGEVRWMRLHSRPRRLPDGRTIWDGVQIDITERKRAEEATCAAQSEAERYGAEMAALMDAVPAVVFIAHDVDCRHMSGSRVTQELLGLPATANFSKSAPSPERPADFRAFKDGREIPADQLPVQMAARGQEIRGYEFDLVFADGTVRTVLGDAVPLRATKTAGHAGQLARSWTSPNASGPRRRCARANAVNASGPRSWPSCSRPCPCLFSSPVTPTVSTSPATAWRTKYCGFPTATSFRCRRPRKPGRSHFRALKDGRELRLDELPAQRAARGEHVKDFEFSLAFDDGMVRHVLG